MKVLVQEAKVNAQKFYKVLQNLGAAAGHALRH